MDTKVRVGTTHIFEWYTPEPVSVGSTPTISFIEPNSGTVLAGPSNMTLFVDASSESITGISADMRTITLSGTLADTAVGMTGPKRGAAFVVSETDGYFPVEVSRVVKDNGSEGATVILAEALPRGITAAGATLYWAGYYVTITSSDVTAEENRDVLWRVSYSPLSAGAAVLTTQTSGMDEGRLSVVRRPFETGVTSSTLKALFSELSQQVPHRQQGWDSQIDAAEDLLVMKLRAELRPLGKWEDDIDGRALALCHSYYTAALISQQKDPEKATAYFEAGDKFLETALRSVWLDANNNGIVDSGEDPTQISGPRQSDVGGSFRTATRTASFTRGQGH